MKSVAEAYDLKCLNLFKFFLLLYAQKVILFNYEYDNLIVYVKYI